MAQAQRRNELSRHFPVGALLAMGATTTLPVDGATQCNSTAGLTTTLRNYRAGLIENNLPYAVIYLGSPYFHEQQQNLPLTLENNDQRGPLWCFFQPMARRTSNASSGLSAEFTDITSVANTRTVADPLVQTVVDDLGDHPSILGYFLDDDVSSAADAENAARNNTLVSSFQALDPYGRPASAMWRNTGYSALGADCQFIVTYEYPCGRDAGGTDTPEGDFHRATFPGITGTSDPDWVDVIRHRIASLPSGARHMWCLQVHHTNTGTAASRLRAPTDRELRTQFWLAVGEGATGLFWFPFTDYDIGGGGGVQPMLGARASALAVAHELSDRLKPNIRKRLLKCTSDAPSTPFTTSGGGTSGLPVDYTSAYVNSLTHTDGTRYVVICNRDTSSANVTVSSASLKGDLVSLETGAVYRLGVDAIPLAALDGTILQYRPFLGVPRVELEMEITKEAWCDKHYANPDGDYFIPYDDIQTHPREVTIPIGGDLQAYVDAAPDNTTFLIPSTGGPYGPVTAVERSGLHFAPATPGGRYELYPMEFFGSEHALQYNSSGSSFGYVSKLYSGSDSSLTTGGVNSIRSQARKRFYREQTRDIFIKNADFVPNGLVYYQKKQIAATWQTDHFYKNAPVNLRTVDGVLIQNCTATGFTWGTDNSSAAPNDPQENILGPTGHPGGFVSGNAGIKNVVVRGCTSTVATNADNRGMPYHLFLDGAQGCFYAENTFNGKQHSGAITYLTNDDYTSDSRNPGTLDRLDFRQARRNVSYGNTFNATGSLIIFNYAGEQFLSRKDVINSNVTTLFGHDSKVCRLASTQHRFYQAYGCTIDEVTVNGNVTTFIEYNTSVGYTPGLDETSPYRSLVGKDTIKNPTISGTVTDWYKLDSGSTVPPEQPILFENLAKLTRTNFLRAIGQIIGDERVLWLPKSTDTTTSTTDDAAGRTITWDADVSGRQGDSGTKGARYQSFTATSSQYGTIADTDGLSFVSGGVDIPWSWWAVIKVTDSASNKTVFSKYAGSNQEYIVTVTGAELLSWIMYDQSAGPAVVSRTSVSALPLETPIMIGGSYDGRGGANAAAGMTLYVNGVEIPSTAATSGGTYVAMENLTAAFEIGSISAHTAQFFNGNLSGVNPSATYFTGEMHAGLYSQAKDWIGTI